MPVTNAIESMQSRIVATSPATKLASKLLFPDSRNIEKD
jgi:hypothetical protein